MKSKVTYAFVISLCTILFNPTVSSMEENLHRNNRVSTRAPLSKEASNLHSDFYYRVNLYVAEAPISKYKQEAYRALGIQIQTVSPEEATPQRLEREFLTSQRIRNYSPIPHFVLWT